MGETMTFQTWLTTTKFEYPLAIDNATEDLIYQYFKLRRCKGDEPFKLWFVRTLSMHYPYYQELLRVDPTVSKYDWFVEYYSENQSVGKTTCANTESGNAVRTNNGSSESSTISTGTSHSDDETTSDSLTGGFARGGALSKANPMSASYTAEEMKAHASDSMTIGDNKLSGYGKNFPNMDIKNPTTASDTLTTNETAVNDKSSATGNTSHAEQGNTTSKHSAQDTTNTASERNATNDSLTQSVTSGRNQLPSDVIMKAKAAIASTTAWDYLYSKLDKCFLSCYDYDDEE